MIFRLIIVKILFFEFTLGNLKVEHVIRTKIGTKTKTVTYLKTAKGFFKTQEINYFDDGRKHSLYSYKNGTKHGKYVNGILSKKINMLSTKKIFYIRERELQKW